MIISTNILAATVLLLVQPYLATANTEIVNFFTVERESVGIVNVSWDLPVLGPSNHEQRFEVQPAPLYTPLKSVCTQSAVDSSNTKNKVWRKGKGKARKDAFLCPHELWFTLDFDNEKWTQFTHFTLRISWPAFHPADFDIEVLTPLELLSYLEYPHPWDSLRDGPKTRTMYARIRVVDTGVLTPTRENIRSTPTPPPVPFMLIVEPLYLGVIPESVLPTLKLLVPVVVIALLLVPYINRYLDGVAANARRQIHKGMKTT